jgi:hypothetical protein
MMTVLAAVICGVTVSFSGAETGPSPCYWRPSERNLEALRDLGLLVLCRDLRLRESSADLCARAPNATSMLNAPLIAPSERPSALVAPVTGKLTLVPVLFAPVRAGRSTRAYCPAASRGRRPIRCSEREVRRVAKLRPARPLALLRRARAVS